MAAEETPTYIGTTVGTDTVNKQDIKQLKEIFVYTADTVDAGDTFTVDLADFNCSTLWGMLGWLHSSEGVAVLEVDTCAVVGTTVTITVVAGSDNCHRFVQLFAV